jgi:hypothetical protein
MCSKTSSERCSSSNLGSPVNQSSNKRLLIEGEAGSGFRDVRLELDSQSTVRGVYSTRPFEATIEGGEVGGDQGASTLSIAASLPTTREGAMTC